MYRDAFPNGLGERHYFGRILTGPFSDTLKERVRELAYHLKALDAIGTQSIPYLAAWSQHSPEIWYEFAGRQLIDLCNCPGNEVAENFKRRVVRRSVFTPDANESPLKQEVSGPQEIKRTRSSVREEILRKQTVEAAYQLALDDGRYIWLKDQATVETFPEDGIFISCGMLFIITKEMELERELKEAKRELKNHRNHLEDLVAHRTRQIWKTQLEMIYRLSKAVGFRDKDTGSHITTISHYCAVLCEALGLSPKAGRILFHAAPMHDVGKIAISDEILFKPGRLDKEEFALMQTHSSIGARLLSGNNSRLLRVARSVALTHHERWDGSGYPHGLAKEKIPLGGRITAICDVFDALTSERPYKKAWSFDAALRELERGRGSHFDPRLVDLFIKNRQRIKGIYQRHRLKGDLVQSA